MTNVINKGNEFVKNNIRWIAIVCIGILGLWADSRYPSIRDFSELKTDFEATKMELLLTKQKLETLSGRFEKKLKIIKQNVKDIDEIENNQIKLQQKK